jgi:hypothetical protein
VPRFAQKVSQQRHRRSSDMHLLPTGPTHRGEAIEIAPSQMGAFTL